MAGRHVMPKRLWRHGIRALLEVLDYNLPVSEEFMLYFLNISYSVVALLHETTSVFADTWMECLGDLGTYQMIINYDEQYDRDIWAGVAKLWYTRALDRHPDVNTLGRRLTVLLRQVNFCTTSDVWPKPYSIQQLSLYCRALAAVHPWNETRQDMMTMFKPFLADLLITAIQQNSLDMYLIKCLAILLTGRSTKENSQYCQIILGQGSLNRYCERATTKSRGAGAAICICTLSGLLEFGVTRLDGFLRSIICQALQDMRPSNEVVSNAGPTQLEPMYTENTGLAGDEHKLSASTIRNACKVAFEAFAAVLRRLQDRNVLPMVHAYAAVLKTVASDGQIMKHIEMNVSWTLFIGFLEHYTNPGTMTKTYLGADSLKPAEDVISRPLPEDFVTREQILFRDYLPSTQQRPCDLNVMKVSWRWTVVSGIDHYLRIWSIRISITAVRGALNTNVSPQLHLG